MDLPIKKLSKLLSNDSAEVRASALLVITELGVKDAEVSQAILACLDDTRAEVRSKAIVASGILKLTKALPLLLKRIPGGGEEAKLAADAAAQLGAEGVKQLQALMGQVAPGIRRYIAASLTGAGSEAGVSVLLDSDPQVASSAAQAIIGRLHDLPVNKRSALLGELISIASDKKKKLPATAELPVLRVLASLNDPNAADVMWERTVPPYSHEVRALALQAAGGWLKNPTKDQWRRLFQNAMESDFNILAPTLAILQRLANSDKLSAEWMQLMHAPDVAARRLAMDKLGDHDSAEYAELLMAQLGHPDKGLRDTARNRLARMEHGRKALVAALLAEESYEELWALARMMMPSAKTLPPKLREQIVTRGCQFVEKDDHRSDPLFALIREIDANALKEQLFDKATAKRKKADHETALKYLKILARDPSVGFDIRLELAMNGLKLSAKELAHDMRNNDPCLRNFHTAIGQNAEEVVKQIEKAKWLDAEDLFYLGFHFVEQYGQEREFGVAVLKHLVKVSPKSKLAANAKNKLKSVVKP